MKIGYYSHEIDFAGTWRSHERIIEVLQHKYECFVFYCPTIEHNRLEISKKILYKTKFIEFQRTQEKYGTGFIPVYTNFYDVAKELNLDILHVARSGYYEWPLTNRIAKLQIETNIFGFNDSSNFLDKSISISSVLKNKSDIIIPNPISDKSEKYENIKDLREELGIPKDAVVLGRIGRASNFTDISLQGYKNFNDLYYIIISPCQNVYNFVKDNNLKNVILLPATNDDLYIERFHKTIDIFAHYRNDGEIHSTAIAQAMMYGIPIITHYAGQNGQKETIGDCGYCVNNHVEYANAIKELLNIEKRKEIGVEVRKKALNYEQKYICSIIDEKYKEWLGNV